MRSSDPRIRVAASVAMVAAVVGGHVLPRLGRGDGAVLVPAAVQAVAAGVLLAGGLRRHRWLGAALVVLLVGGLAVGAAVGGPGLGLMAVAGLGHAALYGGLLAVFGLSLLPGRDSLVTGLARRISPDFHAGKVPYTRKVTLAWCVFFGAQLLVSAGLLVFDPDWWWSFVSVLHLPLVAAMAIGELLVRRWRWRHERSTGLMDTLRGIRRLRAEARAGGAGTSVPAAGCPGHSGSATRHPVPEGSARGRRG